MLRFKDYSPTVTVPDIIQNGVDGIKNAINIYKSYDCFSLTERRNILEKAEKLFHNIPQRTINEVANSKTYRNILESQDIMGRVNELYQTALFESKIETRIKKLAEKSIVTKFCRRHLIELNQIQELNALLESAASIIEQRASPSKGTLNIFDIDDTLFRTNDKVRVIVKGKITKELDSETFAHYKLRAGEMFDFSDFRNGHKFYKQAKPISRMMSFATRLVRFSGPQSRTIIVTARDDFDNKEPFLQRFRESGFPIDQVYVFRAGRDKQANSTGEAKKKIINKLLSSGKYDTVRMWDDSHHNLDAFLQLKKAHPEVKFEAYRVEPSSGTTKPVH